MPRKTAKGYEEQRVLTLCTDLVTERVTFEGRITGVLLEPLLGPLRDYCDTYMCVNRYHNCRVSTGITTVECQQVPQL